MGQLHHEERAFSLLRPHVDGSAMQPHDFLRQRHADAVALYGLAVDAPKRRYTTYRGTQCSCPCSL